MTLIRLIAMTALCTAVLCGCDSDKNNSPVGTWSTSGIKATKADGKLVDTSTSPDWKEQVTINEDGTFTYTSTYSTSVVSGKGTWSAENDMFTFSGSKASFAYSVDGDTMTLSGTVSEGSYELTWTRQ
jgi:hypothetical protein